MKSNEPLVSILLPIYNAEPNLADCLQSLMSQSYTNIEIIAIDNCSKDDSYKILKTFKKKDKRIRAYKNKKRYNVAICLNRAIRRARGTYIAFMNPHDIATRDRIKRQVAFLQKRETIVAVGSQLAIPDENGKKAEKTAYPQEHETICQSLLTGDTFDFQTAMIDKLMLPKDLLTFKQTDYPILFSDLFTKLVSYGKIANLPWVLQYRQKLSHLDKKASLLPMVKLWFSSFANNDYRFPIKTIFTPLAK